MSQVLDDSAEDLPAHEGCASAEEVRLLGRKIDRVLQILTESTDSRKSVMERIRLHDDEIASLKRQQRQSILDHCIRQGAGTATSLLVGLAFLLLGRGFIAEIFTKGHP